TGLREVQPRALQGAAGSGVPEGAAAQCDREGLEARIEGAAREWIQELEGQGRLEFLVLGFCALSAVRCALVRWPARNRIALELVGVVDLLALHADASV